MPPRRRRGEGARSGRRIDQSLVLLGDARPSSAPVWENNRLVVPAIALWAVADGGLVWGVRVDATGEPAGALVQALLTPSAAPFAGRTDLPRQVVLFDEGLARQVQARLPDPRIEVIVAPRFTPFEELFQSLLETLAPQGDPTLRLPDAAVAALCAAMGRLWRAKPWQYAYDHPLIEVRPRRRGARRVFASIMGAARQVYGIALYSSVADYERDAALGAMRQAAGATFGLDDDGEIDAQLDLDPLAYKSIGGRTLLLSFDPRDQMRPEYREQLTRNGWPKRLSVVPTLIGRGGRDNAPDPSEQEAVAAAVAVDTLVTFCERHEDAIVAEAFPIEDTVEISQADFTGQVALSMPPTRRARRS